MPLEEFAVIIDAPDRATNAQMVALEGAFDAVRDRLEITEIGVRHTAETAEGRNREGAAYRVLTPIGGVIIARTIERALAGQTGRFSVGIVRSDYGAAWSAIPELLGIAVGNAALPVSALPSWLEDELAEWLERFGRGLASAIPWGTVLAVGGGALAVVFLLSRRR